MAVIFGVIFLPSPVVTFSLMLAAKIKLQPPNCLLCMEAAWKQERRADSFRCTDLSEL